MAHDTTSGERPQIAPFLTGTEQELRRQQRQLMADLAAVRRTAELIQQAKHEARQRADATGDARWQRLLDRRERHELKAATYQLDDLTFETDAWGWGPSPAQAGDTYFAALIAGDRWDDGETLNLLRHELLASYGVDINDLPTHTSGDDERERIAKAFELYAGEPEQSPGFTDTSALFSVMRAYEHAAEIARNPDAAPVATTDSDEAASAGDGAARGDPTPDIVHDRQAEEQECSACQGIGRIATPEWLAWRERYLATRKAWREQNKDNPRDYFWDESDEFEALQAEEPTRPKCADCDGIGYKPGGDVFASMSLALRAALEGDHQAAAKHYTHARQARGDDDESRRDAAIADDIHALLDRTPPDTTPTPEPGTAAEAEADAKQSAQDADGPESKAAQPSDRGSDKADQISAEPDADGSPAAASNEPGEDHEPASFRASLNAVNADDQQTAEKTVAVVDGDRATAAVRETQPAVEAAERAVYADTITSSPAVEAMSEPGRALDKTATRHDPDAVRGDEDGRRRSGEADVGDSANVDAEKTRRAVESAEQAVMELRSTSASTKRAVDDRSVPVSFSPTGHVEMFDRNSAAQSRSDDGFHL